MSAFKSTEYEFAGESGQKLGPQNGHSLWHPTDPKGVMIRKVIQLLEKN
jgi:hypothetical protein